jgi:hypothetical protein
MKRIRLDHAAIAAPLAAAAPRPASLLQRIRQRLGIA